MQKLALSGVRSASVEALAALGAALDGNRHLEQLSLGCNFISAEGCRALAAAVASHPALRSLSLEHNPIQDSGAAALSAALCGRGSRLTSLSLPFTGAKDGACRALADALAAGAPLASLDLGGNLVTAGGAAALAAALADPSGCALRSLNLAANYRLGPEGALSLAAALPSSGLAELHLAGCAVGAGPVGRIAAAVARSSLRLLDLSHNQIGDRGAWDLAWTIAEPHAQLVRPTPARESRPRAAPPPTRPPHPSRHPLRPPASPSPLPPPPSAPDDAHPQVGRHRGRRRRGAARRAGAQHRPRGARPLWQPDRPKRRARRLAGPARHARLPVPPLPPHAGGGGAERRRGERRRRGEQRLGMLRQSKGPLSRARSQWPALKGPLSRGLSGVGRRVAGRGEGGGGWDATWPGSGLLVVPSGKGREGVGGRDHEAGASGAGGRGRVDWWGAGDDRQGGARGETGPSVVAWACPRRRRRVVACTILCSRAQRPRSLAPPVGSLAQLLLYSLRVVPCATSEKT